MVQKMSVSYKMNIRKHTKLINVDIKVKNKTQTQINVCKC